MPLTLPKLESALRAAFSAPTTNPIVVGNRIADAYVKYAKDGLSVGGGSPVGLNAKKAALAAAIAAGVAAGGPMVSSGVGNGCVALWAALPFTGSPPGVAAPVPETLALLIAGILAADLATTASGGNVPAATVARQWARALDLWTRTVVVSHAPGPAYLSSAFSSAFRRFAASPRKVEALLRKYRMIDRASSQM